MSKGILDRNADVQFEVETLTDGSKVYAVTLAGARIECVDKEAGQKVFDRLTNANLISEITTR